MLCEFYKEKETDVIYWARDDKMLGQIFFSFDKKKLYNVHRDYPKNMTIKEVEIFDKEFPDIAEYYSYRKKK